MTTRGVSVVRGGVPATLLSVLLSVSVFSSPVRADRNKLDLVGTVVEVSVFTGSLGVEKVWVYERDENPYEQLIRIQCDPAMTVWCSDPANFIPGVLSVVTIPDPTLPSVRTITTYTRADGGDGYCMRVNGYLYQSPITGALPIGSFTRDTTCAASGAVVGGGLPAVSVSRPVHPHLQPPHKIVPPVVCGFPMVSCTDGCYSPLSVDLSCFKAAKDAGVVQECKLGITDIRGYCVNY